MDTDSPAQSQGAPPARALDRLEEIAQRTDGRGMAALLDYDGTLTPIVSRPDDANLSEQMRSVVGALADVAIVGVVSGRDLDDVRRRVGLPGLWYAGSHGFDIAGPDGQRHEPAVRWLEAIDAAERTLRAELADATGVDVERKRYSVAVHFRNAGPPAASAAARVVARIVADDGLVRAVRGKEVLDLQPNSDWGKGQAVRWLIRAATGDAGAPPAIIYIGDDVTDESAFTELREDGITVLVGDHGRPTAARYQLGDTGEVLSFLEWARLLACAEPR